MPTLLVTGSSGLVGSECVRHFHGKGWKVAGIDNHERERYFGQEASPEPNLLALQRDIPTYRHFTPSVTFEAGMRGVVREVAPDLVIHAAAQPSHDWAATDPLRDFAVNAAGTLNMLEAVRRHAPEAVFCFLSTNKVYGDWPNRAPLLKPKKVKLSQRTLDALERELETETRLELPSCLWEGFDESWPVDICMHSLFGCSKLAADLYTQEYGRYFGMKTVSFRCGCLTGAAHAGAEQHGFLAYLVKCCREGRPYKVYGYKGKQVRDQLHAYDVARACEEFHANPRPGEVYNLGGGRDNSVSILEAIPLVEGALGKRLAWEYVDQPRKGDHVCYISDTTKFRADYPGWSVTRSLKDIIAELCRV